MDELDNDLLDVGVSRLRTWLLLQSTESELFFRNFQRQVTYRQRNSSTRQDQSADTSSRSTSHSSSSPSASSSSGGTSSRNKRRRDDAGDNDGQKENHRRVFPKEAEPTSTPRLACFYNKYDPIMYRSNGQTHKKFGICETHDFQNMNKLLWVYSGTFKNQY